MRAIIYKLIAMHFLLALFHCGNELSNQNNNRIKSRTIDRVVFGDIPFPKDTKSISVTSRRLTNYRLAQINKFKNLEKLTLAENPITSIEVLRGNTTIKRLTLSYTYVSDLSPLSHNENLELVSVFFSKVRRTEMLPNSLKELVFAETIQKNSLEAYRKNPDCKIIIVPIANLNKHQHPERWWEDPTSKIYKHDYLFEK